MLRLRAKPTSVLDGEALLAALPVAAMTCRPDDLVVDFVNQASVEQLRPIQHVLPCTIDALVGQPIDVFHRFPERARSVLADPSRLPHITDITLGDEILELKVSASRNASGGVERFVLLWRVVTAERARDREVERLLAMLDGMALNVMLVDPKSFTIAYANRTSMETLAPIAKHLPCSPREIVGKSLDIFHAHPERARKVLADPKNLPHRAVIELGSEFLELNISAVYDAAGAYIGPMLNWSLVTAEERLRHDLGELVASTRQRSASVAAGAEELTTTAQEIGVQTQRTSELAESMAERVQLSGERIDALKLASTEIEAVTEVIDRIAEQTKLLALNATIEAARAGEAGRGFAVVAEEVKSLASETSQATGDISRQIEAITQSTGGVVSAIDAIKEGTDELAHMTTTVAAAVEQQTAATRDMTENMIGVSGAADEIERLAENVLDRRGNG